MHLDLTQLEFLSDEQKARYAKLEKFFDTEGWKEVAAYALIKADEQLERLANATTWEANRVAYGARTAFQFIANLEAITELEFAQQAEQAAEAKIEEKEDDHEFE